MQWNDEAILLSVRKYSEHAGIVHGFGRDYGAFRGMSKAAFSKKHRGIFQAGNVLEVQWRARLEEQLGSVRCELITPIAAHCLSDPKALAALNAVTGLLEATMQERDPHPELYATSLQLLDHIAQGVKGWEREYVMFELLLLQETGFRLELSECVATGSRESLCYVSPKSGGAVCRLAGEPYKHKLLALPAFLIDPSATIMQRDIAQALTLTEHFLLNWLFASVHRPIPEARRRLVQLLTQ